MMEPLPLIECFISCARFYVLWIYSTGFRTDLLREYVYVCVYARARVMCVLLGWECLAAVHSGPLLQG